MWQMIWKQDVSLWSLLTEIIAWFYFMSTSAYRWNILKDTSKHFAICFQSFWTVVSVLKTIILWGVFCKYLWEIDRAITPPNLILFQNSCKLFPNDPFNIKPQRCLVHIMTRKQFQKATKQSNELTVGHFWEYLCITRHRWVNIRECLYINSPFSRSRIVHFFVDAP